MSKDTARAVMYANECVEVRKMARIMLQSELAIEQTILRLETVKEFGDVAAQMAPVVSIVNAVKSQLLGVMPEVSYELSTIGETLNNMMVEVGETTGSNYDMVASGEEAQKILKEANTIAEEKMKEKFPELPSPVGTAEKTAIQN